MRKAYIAGNWKMNMTPSKGAAFASELAKAAKEAGADVKMMVAPPFVTIPAVLEALKDSDIIVAAQNMNDHVSGAYTGEVSPEMLKDLGVNTVILGHSERRSYYKESDEFINRKVLLAIEQGMDVVLCVGETLEEREGGRLEEVLTTQLTGDLKDVKAEDMKHITIAYEPVWAHPWPGGENVLFRYCRKPDYTVWWFCQCVQREGIDGKGKHRWSPCWRCLIVRREVPADHYIRQVKAELYRKWVF